MHVGFHLFFFLFDSSVLYGVLLRNWASANMKIICLKLKFWQVFFFFGLEHSIVGLTQHQWGKTSAMICEMQPLLSVNQGRVKRAFPNHIISQYEQLFTSGEYSRWLSVFTAVSLHQGQIMWHSPKVKEIKEQQICL